jgi:hypothetical protein
VLNAPRRRIDRYQLLYHVGVLQLAFSFFFPPLFLTLSQGYAISVPAEWQPVAAPLLASWEATVRASSAVENWHSVLRPYLAVHRSLSSGMVVLLAVWHNHRIAERGLHCGQSPLMRSGMTPASPDWLIALGYPPHGVPCSPESLVDSQPTLALAA